MTNEKVAVDAGWLEDLKLTAPRVLADGDRGSNAPIMSPSSSSAMCVAFEDDEDDEGDEGA
jgi:hypothetical protein